MNLHRSQQRAGLEEENECEVDGASGGGALQPVGDSGVGAGPDAGLQRCGMGPEPWPAPPTLWVPVDGILRRL
ncbi:hypothetical protein NDU88_006146 [Pleurodeles waltl]|uniref:Uncharacterized protein n=1 Tax=Pleurodeles waltl TaxID=8319 RepID=A0AAV7NPD5_PLEWA|nr:hypothetical protein NDU88_006146 [Pleurodeles waltl]